MVFTVCKRGSLSTLLTSYLASSAAAPVPVPNSGPERAVQRRNTGSLPLRSTGGQHCEHDSNENTLYPAQRVSARGFAARGAAHRGRPQVATSAHGWLPHLGWGRRKCNGVSLSMSTPDPCVGRRCWTAISSLRGGSVVGDMDRENEAQGTDGVASVRSMKVLVSTAKISSYVDTRGEVLAQSDWTVGRLKEELEKTFPGNIPASLQRLFKGTQLLHSRMTLEEASEGAEGPLTLLLDNSPPMDALKFDPDTAVPSRRDGQVEAFSACLAAQSALQDSLLAVMRGEDMQDDAELTRSVKLKADFENTQVMLRRTFEERPDPNAGQQETFGILHEALRPLAHRLDVDWVQSVKHALFAFICAQFGAPNALRRVLTLAIIPLLFLAQTRQARVGFKLSRNLVAEVPLIKQLVLGLMQAPGQVILSLDTGAYTTRLYGEGGPKYDERFVESLAEGGEPSDEGVGQESGGEGRGDEGIGDEDERSEVCDEDEFDDDG